MDKAHNQTESILVSLETRLRRLYRKGGKRVQEEITPLLEAVVLDKDDSTQRQRLLYAEKHGLSEIAGTYADHIVEANKKAVRDINRTALQIYSVNFDYMAQFFKREAGVDITDDK